MYTLTNSMVAYMNMDTSKKSATSTDMADNNIYILINSSAFQEPQYYPEIQGNGSYFLPNLSVNSNDNNDFMTIFNPDNFPYEDKITDTEFVYEIEVEDKTNENEHET